MVNIIKMYGMTFSIKYKIAAIFTVIVMILIFTNPSLDDFSAFSERHNINKGRVAMNRDENYFIFSKYSLVVISDDSAFKNNYIGFFGTFYRVGESQAREG